MPEVMKYLELTLINPINKTSVDSLFVKISKTKCYKLLIDTGAHDFEDLNSLKELKIRFETEDLSHIKKIAFLHPRKFQNISQDPERYQYFTDKQKAIHWLEE